MNHHGIQAIHALIICLARSSVHLHLSLPPQPKILFLRGEVWCQVQVLWERHVVVELLEPMRKRDHVGPRNLLESLEMNNQNWGRRPNEIALVCWPHNDRLWT